MAQEVISLRNSSEIRQRTELSRSRQAFPAREPTLASAQSPGWSATLTPHTPAEQCCTEMDTRHAQSTSAIRVGGENEEKEDGEHHNMVFISSASFAFNSEFFLRLHQLSRSACCCDLLANQSSVCGVHRTLHSAAHEGVFGSSADASNPTQQLHHDTHLETEK